MRMRIRPERAASRIGKTVLGGLAAMALLFSFASHAQVQRSFINLSFEDPDLGGVGCRVYIAESLVPGWTTNHPSGPNQNAGCAAVPPGFVGGSGPLLEIWETPRGTYNARSGSQMAELNAAAAARISQNVCFIAGEQVAWRFSHSGRHNPTIPDTARFLIGPAPVVLVGTTNTGSGGVITTFQGTATSAAGPGAWRDYSGSFTVATSGVSNIGFEAVTTATGQLAEGNFLDDIQITIRPLIEFTAATFSQPEQGPAATVQVRIVGLVPAGGITVPITAGGTATSGSDYTLGTLTIPAGDYGSGATVNVPITIINDTLIENNETVSLTIPPHSASSPYVLGSTTACGGAAIGTATLTIVDNDIDLATTKTVGNATPITGVPFTYTVTYRNNTAAPTVAPTTAHNATAAIVDNVPAGLTFTAWTCQASNGASCPGGTVNGTTSGSGSISGNAILPARSGAAGGLLTYTITAVAAANSCNAIVNTSTIATPSGMTEGASVQAGFASPAPGGTANNAATATVNPVCTVVRLRKALPDGRAVDGHQFSLLISGPNGQGQVATTGSGTVANGIAVVDPATPGGSYEFSEAPFSMANLDDYTTTWNCTNALAGGQTPSGSGNSFTLTPTAGDNLTCTFVNAVTPKADLWIRKTNTPSQGPDDQAGDVLLSGSETTYTIVVGNNGPANADGAVVRDPLPDGMTCHSATCGGETGGAACPAVSVSALQGAGVAIPTFPAGSTLTLTLTCTVD